jgi:nucleoside-diphosphate-sugar epimerase
VTGGCGFVGSNILRAWLRGDDGRSAIAVDISSPDAAAVEWFADVAARLEFVQADLRDPLAFAGVSSPDTITHVVHAAMIAHVPEWEQSDPRRFLDVNIGGTVNALEWARTLPALERFVYISTGGVYGDPTAASPTGPQPEDGPFNPPELYPISKLACEAIARRYAALFGLDLRITRLSGVFGPMERRTSGRTIMSAGHAVASAICAGRPLRVSRRGLAAGGDFLSAEDIADGTVRLLTARADALHHAVYNLAFGTFTGLRELLDAAQTAAPALQIETAEPGGQTDIDMDPADRLARWNAYAIDRAEADLGWAPRPLREQISSYLTWVDGDARRL